jgi:hypothetical protein
VQGSAYLSLPLVSTRVLSLSLRSVIPVVWGEGLRALVHSTLMFIKGFGSAKTKIRPLGLKSRNCVTSVRA